MTRIGQSMRINLWRRGGLLLLLLGASSAAFAALPAEAEETSWESLEGVHTETQVHEIPFQPGGQVHIQNRNGEVTLIGWDRDLISIQATKRIDIRKSSKGWFWKRSSYPFQSLEEAKRYFDKMKIEIDAKPGRVKVESVFPSSKSGVNSGVDLIVNVPREIDPEIVTSNGAVAISETQGKCHLSSSNGTIRAERVNGPCEIGTSNGGIAVTDCRGSFHLTSSNGRIECASLCGPIRAWTSNGEVQCKHFDGSVTVTTSNSGIHLERTAPPNGQDEIRCQTSNGNIRLILPEGSDFDLDSHTSNGTIQSEFALVKTRPGSKQALQGRSGKGGAIVSLSTSNGSIHLIKQ